MRVMVFEAGTGGHVFNYHRLLLPALDSLANELVVVVPQGALDTPYAQIQLQSLPASIRWDACVPPPTGTQVRRQLGSRRALVDAIKRHRPDHIFVPTADAVSQALGLGRAFGQRDLPPGVEAEGALHRAGFAYPAMSTARALMYRAGYSAHCLAPWTRLFSVDVVAYEWIQRRGGSLAQRNFLLPDPIETPPPSDRLEARRRLGIPVDGEFLGCAGIIDERKGANLLLDAFRHAKLSENARLLLAGEHSGSIRSLLRTEFADLVRRGRIVSIDRYLGVNELHDAISALDLVCTPYDRQLAIASIVVRAAAARRPVLATNFGWCGRLVPALKLGWTCAVHNPIEFGHAIGESMSRTDDWQVSEAAKRLCQFHAPENFVAVFTTRIRERLGLPPSTDALSWSYVDRAIDSRSRVATSGMVD